MKARGLKRVLTIAALLYIISLKSCSSPSIQFSDFKSPVPSIASGGTQEGIMPHKRWMVYYTVGGHSITYIEMLKFSLSTVRSFGENDEIDVFVIGDARFVKAVEMFLPVSIRAISHNTACETDETIDPSICYVLSSMRKTHVFDIIPHINLYDAVLFLDADLVVTGPLDALFEEIGKDKGKIHVMNETDGFNDGAHRTYFWSHDDYTEAEITRMAQSNVPVFNAGQFGFCPTKEMHSHFNALNANIRAHGEREAFFEQSFMNRYFNPKLLTTNSLNHYVSFQKFDASKPLTHAPGVHNSKEDKLKVMRCAWEAFLVTNTLRIHNSSRYALHEYITSASRIVEVGSSKNNGKFAQYLLNSFHPKKLWLVDLWGARMYTSAPSSSAKDGQNFQLEDTMYHNILKRFHTQPNVVVLRKRSSVLYDVYTFDEHSIDLVYLNGGQSSASFDEMLSDLEAALRVLKPGTGWLAGEWNRDDALGQKVVFEFCVRHGFRPWHLFSDGANGRSSSTSTFVIRV